MGRRDLFIGGGNEMNGVVGRMGVMQLKICKKKEIIEVKCDGHG